MNSHQRRPFLAPLLYLLSFAGILLLGFFAQRYAWWHDWGFKTVLISWALAWIVAAIWWIAPHLD